jgi:hypothetical protein
MRSIPSVATRGSFANGRPNSARHENNLGYRPIRAVLVGAALVAAVLASAPSALAGTRPMPAVAVHVPSSFTAASGEHRAGAVPDAPLPATVPVSAVYLANGLSDVFFVSGGQVHYWAYTQNPVAWTQHTLDGEAVKAGTGIAANQQPNGNIAVYYVGSNGEIYNWLYVASDSTWENGVIIRTGEKAAPSTDISVIQNGDEQTVFYVGADDQIWIWSFDVHWTNTELAGDAAVPADGLASDIQSNGYRQVFYTGTNGQIYNWINNTTEWLNGAIGAGEAAVNGSQLTDILLTNGDLDVFYVGTNHQVYVWAYVDHWANHKLGAGGKVASHSGLAADEQPNGYLSVYYAGPGGQMYNWLFTSHWANAPINTSGTPVQAGSAISVNELDQTDTQVYYLNGDTVWDWWFTGAHWYNYQLP